MRFFMTPEENKFRIYKKKNLNFLFIIYFVIFNNLVVTQTSIRYSSVDVIKNDDLTFYQYLLISILKESSSAGNQ